MHAGLRRPSEVLWHWASDSELSTRAVPQRTVSGQARYVSLPAVSRVRLARKTALPVTIVSG